MGYFYSSLIIIYSFVVIKFFLTINNNEVNTASYVCHPLKMAIQNLTRRDRDSDVDLQGEYYFFSFFLSVLAGAMLVFDKMAFNLSIASVRSEICLF